MGTSKVVSVPTPDQIAIAQSQADAIGASATAVITPITCSISHLRNLPNRCLAPPFVSRKTLKHRPLHTYRYFLHKWATTPICGMVIVDGHNLL